MKEVTSYSEQVKPRIDLDDCATICDACKIMIEDERQQIADAEQAESKINPKQSDEAEEVDPIVDLEDCTRLRLEIFAGFCARPKVVLILEFLNLFIGSVIAYEEGSDYSEALLLATGIFLASLLTSEVVPISLLDLTTLFFGKYEVDEKYLYAWHSLVMALAAEWIKSILLWALTLSCILNGSWIALAWAYKDPAGGLKQLMVPLALQCYAVPLIYFELKHFLQLDGKVDTPEATLARRAWVMLDFLGRARALSLRISSVEEMEGFEFPKGIGVATIYLAPDLIPGDECSLITCYLRRYLFVKFSNYLGCEYKKIESDYKIKREEKKGTKEYWSTYNVASRWCTKTKEIKPNEDEIVNSTA